MARQTNFLIATMNAAIRQHNAEVRQQNALSRQAEQDYKQAKREKLAQKKEFTIQYATDKTLEAEAKRVELNSLLTAAIKSPLSLDWNSFKRNEFFPISRPQKPESRTLPDKVDESSFAPKFGLLDFLFRSKKERAIQLSKDLLTQAINANEKEIKFVELENARDLEKYKEKTQIWIAEKKEFEKKVAEHNADIDRLADAFSRSEEDAVEFFFNTVLQQIGLPEETESEWQLKYEASSKILIVDFALPGTDIIPNLKLMKYVATRNEFSETYLKQKEVDQIYEELLLQLCLRVTNDLYVSDIDEKLSSIVFNGIYSGLNKSTGKEETKYIMSLQTQKLAFKDIAIEHVDAKACFLKFRGVAGNKLSEFIPVPPVLTLERTDARFVESIDISETINGMNLASMDWESFEHLIRELFEKEFATNGSEVRITQASRDGGVDAVMFDPDPIRGGKYVIQAKRYTNVVGVSAVRDLYGTLMNEGAVKGILVTTANYGADSYEFAKDKPITLINGSNLLHMLQKHGYQARIDLKEAKRLMSEDT
jgi:restriction system protein